jgi:hypothetical protein
MAADPATAQHPHPTMTRWPRCSCDAWGRLPRRCRVSALCHPARHRRCRATLQGSRQIGRPLRLPGSDGRHALGHGPQGRYRGVRLPPGDRLLRTHHSRLMASHPRKSPAGCGSAGPACIGCWANSWPAIGCRRASDHRLPEFLAMSVGCRTSADTDPASSPLAAGTIARKTRCLDTLQCDRLNWQVLRLQNLFCLFQPQCVDVIQR